MPRQAYSPVHMRCSWSRTAPSLLHVDKVFWSPLPRPVVLGCLYRGEHQATHQWDHFSYWIQIAGSWAVRVMSTPTSHMGVVFVTFHNGKSGLPLWPVEGFMVLAFIKDKERFMFTWGARRHLTCSDQWSVSSISSSSLSHAAIWLILVQVGRKVSDKYTIRLIGQIVTTLHFSCGEQTLLLFVSCVRHKHRGKVMHCSIWYLFYCTDNREQGNVLNIWIADVHYPVSCLLIGTVKFMMHWRKVSVVMFGFCHCFIVLVLVDWLQ